MTLLNGLRVIECGVAIAAPTATRYLAHLGAQVIKVDSGSDGLRAGGPSWAPKDAGPAGPDMLAGANATNAQKQSISLNLKHPLGRETFLKLVASADVFVSNLSLPAVQSLHLDWDSLRKHNPSLIHLVMPGFGAEGPYKDYKSWGPNLSSLTGYDYLTGYADREPVMTPVPLPDYISGYHAVVAILAALEGRHRDGGRGQQIHMGQFMTTVACLGHELAYASVGGVTTRDGNRLKNAAPHNVFPCAGADRWVAISVLSDADWARMAEAMGQPHLTRDARFATVVARKANEDELEALVCTWTRMHTPREVAIKLQAAGVAAAPLQEAIDHAADPQLEARGYWKLVSHRRIGVDIVNGLPMQFSGTPLAYESAAPPVSDDSTDVFRSVGLDDDQVREMFDSGAAQKPFEYTLPGVEDSPGRPWFKWALPFVRPSTESGERHEIPKLLPVNDDLSRGPLTGVRVLDLSDARSAYGTRLLASLGADVSRIDVPGGPSIDGVAPVHNGVSLYAAFNDAGKSRESLDTGTVAGAARLRELLEDADVLYDSTDGSQIALLGLDSAEIARRYPRLIHVRVSAFGSSGPYANWAADDLTLWALSGMLQVTGYPDRPPVGIGGDMGHYLVGTHGAIAAIAAIIARRSTGLGQAVDISAHEVLLTTAGPTMVPSLEDMLPKVRAGSRALSAAPWGFFECSDRLVSLLALFPDHWDNLAKWIAERTGNEAALDQKYRGSPMSRNVHVAEVTALINSLAGLYEAGDFCREAQSRGVPACPVNSLHDLLADPHLAELSFWQSVEVPGLGPVTFPGAPFVIEPASVLELAATGAR